jgi:coenzyme F420 hydrogenase subunit beta
MRPRDIPDVARQRLCAGCGVCAYLAPDDIAMVDDISEGRRPLKLVDVGRPPADRGAMDDAMRACPGAALAHEPAAFPAGADAGLLPEWGPVLELWEGYAADPQLRHGGSSGGAASALSLALLEAGAHGVLHSAAREDAPLLNETVLSTSRDELLTRTGSRYAPASPADGLARVESAPGDCVFIGKPCDVAATTSAARLRPALAQRLALTIAVFCAGTPSTQGTYEMVRAMGFERPEDVRTLRYRGNGWPGRAEASGTRGGAEHTASLTYAESWGDILQRHRQWRCHLCLDHTGEFADVSVGDPWYREIPDDEPGRSLVVVRTERGRQAVAAAVAAGHLVLERVAPDVLPRSQPNLLVTRGAVWGRIATLRVMGLAAPRYRAMPALRAWLRLDARQKLQSTLGTARRVRARGLRRPLEVTPLEAPAQVSRNPARPGPARRGPSR